ncbi:gamma-glutamyl-gamma-aminobutyrate hydrolase family protein [Caldibacillus lycopersici]|uniref:Gamma-glutamyl-gamma-aminobutyrate hydrolase family protein n=1 Tax=Perspicuibacillus lycopersici TaxID=1325689 RepID=A0AAE3IVX6_9BACI|nr:gamma-glutamyl-gamma-aminobutyrate hydrolase family protein [Perspicuibacillus lycopersici]MCU9614598.1 gamma-glutamyl-gamma-aminobutyrate hydrolase family protein [Perspicuibacillus lycopersici]
MKRPVIGVMPLYDEEKESYWMLPSYLKGIVEAGGIPIILPLINDSEAIKQLVESLDGFLLTGGQDVNPELYGERASSLCGKPLLARDTLEEFVIKYALEADKPILGICRGLQILNAVLGGTLYQDIPTQVNEGKTIVHQQEKPYDTPIHAIHIEKNSLLYDLYQQECVLVNSLHHQGIKTLAKSLHCEALAEDGIVEAAFMPGKKFVHALQWHPEYMLEVDEPSRKLFQSFVTHCVKLRKLS